MGKKMKIGLIAGNGQFPIIFSRAAREKGYRVVAAAVVNEADESLKDFVDEIEWMHLGQVGRLLKYFKKNGVTDAVMLGAIRKTRIFTDIRPDMKAVTLLAGMKNTHDDGLLRSFATMLEKEGITVRASTFLLPEILAEAGCWTKKRPGRASRADMELGWKLAKEIGRLDIGQCIVVGGGSVLAVEAVDGTDATIKRGGALGNGNAVVIKVSKPNQDLRFDVPAIGLETVRNMHEAGAKVLVIEAGKAVVFDRPEMIDFADRVGISIVAME